MVRKKVKKEVTKKVDKESILVSEEVWRIVIEEESTPILEVVEEEDTTKPSPMEPNFELFELEEISIVGPEEHLEATTFKIVEEAEKSEILESPRDLSEEEIRDITEEQGRAPVKTLIFAAN